MVGCAFCVVYFQSMNKTAADRSAVGPVVHRGAAELGALGLLEGEELALVPGPAAVLAPEGVAAAPADFALHIGE